MSGYRGGSLQPDVWSRHSLEYLPPAWLRSGHLQTVWPSLFRRVSPLSLQPERIATADGDYLDIDWYRRGHRRLVILSHGLEGNSRRPYMQGMARSVLAEGWDALAWNFRSCSGSMNTTPRFYHSGATADLDAVVQYALHQGGYDQVVLGGFSMGGNLVLVYLGERGAVLDARLVGGFAFSVPCDLSASAARLAMPSNRLYMRRFMRSLRQKMREKQQRFPQLIDVSDLERIKTFQVFDDRFTAPLHGFRDAEDYWRRCSSRHFLRSITLPTLLVNALDDPFLTPACFPGALECGSHVELETPRWGGHVGFMQVRGNGEYWSEQRVRRFLQTWNV